MKPPSPKFRVDVAISTLIFSVVSYEGAARGALVWPFKGHFTRARFYVRFFVAGWTARHARVRRVQSSFVVVATIREALGRSATNVNPVLRVPHTHTRAHTFILDCCCSHASTLAVCIVHARELTKLCIYFLFICIFNENSCNFVSNFGGGERTHALPPCSKSHSKLKMKREIGETIPFFRSFSFSATTYDGATSAGGYDFCVFWPIFAWNDVLERRRCEPYWFFF